MLHIQGDEVPDTRLRACAAEGDGGTCGLRLPGSAGDREVVGGSASNFTYIPRGHEPVRPFKRKLKADGLSDEKWKLEEIN